MNSWIENSGEGGEPRFLADLRAMVSLLADRLETVAFEMAAGSLRGINAEGQPSQGGTSKGPVILCDFSPWRCSDVADEFDLIKPDLRLARLILFVGARGAITRLSDLIGSLGLTGIFEGWCWVANGGEPQLCHVWIVQGEKWLCRSRDLPRIVGLIACYNEIDILESSLNHLVSQGIEPYVIDNWSTDGSYELARSRVGKDLLGVERFPLGGRGPNFEIGFIIKRKEALLGEIDADWFLNTDVDEFRDAPFEAMTLREAVGVADASGFNSIDFTLLDFVPQGAPFDPERLCSEQLQRWRPGFRHGHFIQKKLWKHQGRPVDLYSSGAHEARFPGRRIFPFNFLLRHYSLRSPDHAYMKFRDRRVGGDDSAKSWGYHYGLDPFEGANPTEIQTWKFDAQFYEEYLLQRLTALWQGDFRESLCY